MLALVWSESRRSAWDALESSPNEYYHAYLPPGEKPASAEWSAREVSNFERLIKEHKEKVEGGQWGLLSMHHPGRTGAQCKDRYKRLMAAAAAPKPSPSPAHCHELGSKGATGSAGRSVAASQHSAAASTFSFDSGSSVRHDDNPTPHGRPT